MKKIVVAVVIFLVTLISIPLSFQVIYQAKTTGELIEKPIGSSSIEKNQQNNTEISGLIAKEQTVLFFEKKKMSILICR